MAIDAKQLDSRNPIYQREEQFEPEFEDYHGFRIKRTTSEWARKYNQEWEIGDGDDLVGFATIDEAKQWVDDLIRDNEDRDLE